MEVLKPSPQLLIKLGSLIVHYGELLTPKGHHFDKVAVDSLLDDDEVKQWLSEMDEMALLPKVR